MLPHPLNIWLYGYAVYLLVMFIFLCVAVILHETGHIIFAKYHHLDYKILFEKGNLKIAADWQVLGNRKIYGNILGIVFGLPAVVIGTVLYPTPIFLLIYMVACYDDLREVLLGLMRNKY
jgi:hypothetical protein